MLLILGKSYLSFHISSRDLYRCHGEGGSSVCGKEEEDKEIGRTKNRFLFSNFWTWKMLTLLVLLLLLFAVAIIVDVLLYPHTNAHTLLTSTPIRIWKLMFIWFSSIFFSIYYCSFLCVLAHAYFSNAFSRFFLLTRTIAQISSFFSSHSSCMAEKAHIHRNLMHETNDSYWNGEILCDCRQIPLPFILFYAINVDMDQI